MDKLAKKIFHTQMTGLFSLFSGLLTTLILTFLLTPEDYGVYSVILSFITFSSVFLCQNLFAYSRIEIPLKKDGERYGYLKATLLLPVILLFIFSVIFSFFPFLSGVFLNFFKQKPDFSSIFILIIFLDILLREIKRFYQACSNPVVSNNSEILFRFSYILLIAFWALMVFDKKSTFDLSGVLFIFMLSQITSLLYLIGKMDVKAFFASPLCRDVYIKGYPFALMLLPLALTNTAVTALDRTMLSHLCGFSETARYALSCRFITPVSAIVTSSVLLVIFPYIASASKSGVKRQAYYHLSGQRISALFSLLIFLVMLLPSIVVKHYYLSGGTGHYGALYTVLPVIGTIPFFETLFVSASNTLQIVGRIKRVSFVMPLFIGINFILNYYLIPLYRSAGAAAASSATFFLLSLSANFVLAGFFKQSQGLDFFKFYIKTVVIGSLVFIAGIAVVLGITDIVYSISALVSVYGLALFIFYKNGLLRKKDFRFLEKIRS